MQKKTRQHGSSRREWEQKRARIQEGTKQHHDPAQPFSVVELRCTFILFISRLRASSLSLWLFWYDRNWSLTTAVGCPLNFHQFKWTLFVKWKSREIWSRYSHPRGGKGYVRIRDRVHLVSFSHLSRDRFMSPAESSISRCSFWLTSHPDHHADYICSAGTSAEQTEWQTDTERKTVKSFLITCPVFVIYVLRVQQRSAPALLQTPVVMGTNVLKKKLHGRWLQLRQFKILNNKKTIHPIFRGTVLSLIPESWSLNSLTPASACSLWLLSSRTSQRRQQSNRPVLINLFIPGQV